MAAAHTSHAAPAPAPQRGTASRPAHHRPLRRHLSDNRSKGYRQSKNCSHNDPTLGYLTVLQQAAASLHQDHNSPSTQPAHHPPALIDPCGCNTQFMNSAHRQRAQQAARQQHSRNTQPATPPLPAPAPPDLSHMHITPPGAAAHRAQHTRHEAQPLPPITCPHQLRHHTTTPAHTRRTLQQQLTG
jgi:hypothetical protein